MTDEITNLEDEVTLLTDKAIIDIAPAKDERVAGLMVEVAAIAAHAEARVVASDADVKLATEDLSLIAKLKKAIGERKTEWEAPIKSYLATVTESFKALTGPLEQADKTTRDKILRYRSEVEERRRQAEEINRQKIELAKKEAAFNQTGEITVDTTPVVVPTSAPTKVHTEVGSLGSRKVRKWEVVDFAAVPDQYKIVDAGRVKKVVDAGGAIPGIRTWEEDTLVVRPGR